MSEQTSATLSSELLTEIKEAYRTAITARDLATVVPMHLPTQHQCPDVDIRIHLMGRCPTVRTAVSLRAGAGRHSASTVKALDLRPFCIRLAIVADLRGGSSDGKKHSNLPG